MAGLTDAGRICNSLGIYRNFLRIPVLLLPDRNLCRYKKEWESYCTYRRHGLILKKNGRGIDIMSDTLTAIQLKHVLQWHITNLCNLQCSHCYQEYRDAISMDYGDMENILKQYLDFTRKYGYRPHINITGGEPFLHPDIFRLLDLLEQNKVSFGILANGTATTEDMIKCLARYSCLSFVQASIDGTKQTHDSIRGKGSWKKTMETFRLLRKNGIQTMAAFTCHKRNYKELRAVINDVRKHGIDRFWCDRLIPIGNNREDVLTTEEYRRVIAVLEEESMRKTFGKRTAIHRNRALQFYGYCCTEGIYQCSAGSQLLVVTEDGTLLPCRRLPIPLGNVLRDGTIEEICDNSPVIQTLTAKKVPDGCKGCLVEHLCRGGAKCLSYALIGQYENVKDVNCTFGE